jgi:simple sugar transport system substrate-binding protein
MFNRNRSRSRRADAYEVDPKQYETSRRRFLRNAGIAAASVPFLGGLVDVLTERGAAAQSFRDESSALFASHPAYKLNFVNAAYTNVFFTPMIYGLQDAAALVGIPTPVLTGSLNSLTSDMVTAMNQAIAAKDDGIGVMLIDPVAFNAPTDRALNEGIPVVAYNSDVPGNNRLAYIGQNNTTAGQAAAERIVKVVPKGGLVGMVIDTPGTSNVQPRVDSAVPIFKAAGLDYEQIDGGLLAAAEITAVEAWYQGHKDVKFLYTVDNGDSLAVAALISKFNLKGKVGGSGWNIPIPVLQAVQDGNLEFTIDQQTYLQGFVPTIQLFLYLVSGGLMKPSDTDTGLGFVTKANVAGFLAHTSRFEGTQTKAATYKPPPTILY